MKPKVLEGIDSSLILIVSFQTLGSTPSNTYALNWLPNNQSVLGRYPLLSVNLIVLALIFS